MLDRDRVGRWPTKVSDSEREVRARLRWQCWRRRADLGCQAATPAPEARGGGSASRQAVFMVVAIEDVRMPAVPFVYSLSASLPVRVACRVEWTVSGQM